MKNNTMLRSDGQAYTKLGSSDGQVLWVRVPDSSGRCEYCGCEDRVVFGLGPERDELTGEIPIGGIITICLDCLTDIEQSVKC